jgi:hypothetical protein
MDLLAGNSRFLHAPRIGLADPRLGRNDRVKEGNAGMQGEGRALQGGMTV